MKLLLQMHLSLKSTEATEYIVERHSRSLNAVGTVLEKPLLVYAGGPNSRSNKQTYIMISKVAIGMICN